MFHKYVVEILTGIALNVYVTLDKGDIFKILNLLIYEHELALHS